MGESYGAWKMGADAEVMPHISSANIACGFHGGDPATIRKTVRLAQIAPGGTVHFARTTLDMAAELRKDTRSRMETMLRGIAWEYGK